MFVRSSPGVIALGRTTVHLPGIGILNGPCTRTDIDATIITDPRKTVIGRTIGVDLRMTATDIEKIVIDQPMTTTNTITTGTITTNRDIHDTIGDLPITIATLVPREIINDPRIIDVATLPALSLHKPPNTPSLGKTCIVVNPTPHRQEMKIPQYETSQVGHGELRN